MYVVENQRQRKNLERKKMIRIRIGMKMDYFHHKP